MTQGDDKGISVAALELTVVAGWPIDIRIEWLTGKSGMPLAHQSAGSVHIPLEPVGRERALRELALLLGPARLICWSPPADLSLVARREFEDCLPLVSAVRLAERIASGPASNTSVWLLRRALSKQKLSDTCRDLGVRAGLDPCSAEVGLLSVALHLSATGEFDLGVAA